MINRFKNVFINAVGHTNPAVDESNGGHVPGSSQSSTHQNQNGAPSKESSTKRSSMRRNSEAPKKPVKYEYCRPHFLHIQSADEIQVSADHAVRPIIVPRDVAALPWGAGYAETINSGKSKKNEDQARVHSGVIKIPLGSSIDEKTDLSTQDEKTIDIPYRYFGIFDGHAGPGAAIAAASQLHLIIHERLQDIGHHLVDDGPFCESSVRNKIKGILWFPQTNITNDSLIVGALEASFQQMDQQIEQDNKVYDGVNGGCTVVVCLFILGKIFIANAGDSRAILCRRNHEALPLSNDFTPESERTRVRQLAAENPHLLGTDFTALEFLRRPVRKDIGSRILYRGGHMTGWAYKIATEEDLRFPVVFGYGKRSRVLATIGVTRGFGDHELSAHSSNIKIKPFLKSQPEVRIVDMRELNCGEDDVIIMATDGLWDVTSNDQAATVAFSTLDQFPSSDTNRFKYRNISAAQDLVMHARGKFNERNWKMSDGSVATIDDIAVFVIPIWPYKVDVMQEISERKKKSTTDPVMNGGSNSRCIDTCEDSVLNGDEIDLLVRTNPKVPKLRDGNGNANDSPAPEPQLPVNLSISEEILIAEMFPTKKPEPDEAATPDNLEINRTLTQILEDNSTETKMETETPTLPEVINEDITPTLPNSNETDPVPKVSHKKKHRK